ncbi:hypothetical protein BDZ45DRAFT_750667 [Acephala macrosclerotiorum]|nr:hypothetical protein BDZ45DRAFT_750667 [Acephala macrosclerotiorum]
MDPLTVLSVASNIIQFIDFGNKLISTGRKVYSSASGALVENLEIETGAESVYQLSHRVSDSLETMRAVPVLYRLNRRGSQVTTSIFSSRDDQEAERLIQSRNENDAALRNLRVACRDVSRELIGALENPKNPEKIQLLTKRLSDLRAQLDSAILFSLRVQINELATQSENVRGVVETVQADTQAIRAELLGHIQQSQRWQADLISTIYQSKFEQQDRYQIQSISSKLLGMAEADWRNHFELKLINRLRFPGMSDRKARIASAHTKTFELIYRDPEEESQPWGNFVKWFESDENLYWITGKPGSGKSTLMKYISKDPRTWHHLNAWTRGMPLITAGFFFWNSGSEMRMSSTGLLQTLLFSCLRQQSLVSHTFQERWQACEMFGEGFHPWSWMELMDAFKLFVSKAGEERKIFSSLMAWMSLMASAQSSSS